MSSLRVTVDDGSPLIDYQPPDGWVQKNSSTDPTGSNYFAGTFSRAQQLGASASLTFNGSSITIYGGKSTKHGNYTVTVDGKTQDVSGFSTVAQYQVPLFTTDALNNGTHAITIANTQYAFMDIDYIIWTSEISSSRSGPVTQLYVDDANEAFQYVPAGAWSDKPSNLNQFSSSTGHTTSTPKAAVHYNFTVREAVSLYGTVGPNNGPYSVQLDGQPAKTYLGNKTTYGPQSLLFYASNLGYKTHILVVTSLGSTEEKLEIDYALSHTVDSVRVSSTIPVNPGETGAAKSVSSNKTGLSSGNLSGVVVGVVAIVSLIIALCILLRRNKTLWAKLQRGYSVQSQFDATPPPYMATVGDSETGFHVASDAKSSQRDIFTNTTSGTQSTELSSEFSQPMTSTRIRPLSMLSTLSSTASTLVAEDGSVGNPGGARRHLRLKRGSRQISTIASSISSPPPVPAIPSRLTSIRPPGQMMTIDSVPDLLDLSSPPPTTIREHFETSPIPSITSPHDLHDLLTFDAISTGAATARSESLLLPPEYSEDPTTEAEHVNRPSISLLMPLVPVRAAFSVNGEAADSRERSNLSPGLNTSSDSIDTDLWSPTSSNALSPASAGIQSPTSPLDSPPLIRAGRRDTQRMSAFTLFRSRRPPT